MKFSTTSIIALFALTATQSHAFSTQQRSAPQTAFGLRSATPSPFSMPTRTNTIQLHATPDTKSEQSEEVQRLQAMAAKLRSEAADLEAQQATERAKAADKAFQQFDINQDGEVTIDELKAALEKTFKLELPQDRVESLMATFDKSGDGKLQKDEFPTTVEQFRNRLEQMKSDERRKALDLTKQAQKEAEVSELIESQLALINDKEPTGTDKIVSVLPYLFPLLDSVMVGQHFLVGHESNPAVTALAIVYGIYRSIPLSGFLSFFALSSATNNLSINKLVRYNMQQAIFLDVALFVPGLLGVLAAAASSGLGLQLPMGTGEIASDAVFLAMLATLAYSSVSSLAGKTPDKIPFISKAVNERMPSIDAAVFDDEGRFDPSKLFGNKDDDEKKN